MRTHKKTVPDDPAPASFPFDDPLVTIAVGIVRGRVCMRLGSTTCPLSPDQALRIAFAIDTETANIVQALIGAAYQVEQNGGDPV